MEVCDEIIVESSLLSSLLFCISADEVVRVAAPPDFVLDGCMNLKFNKLYHFKDADSGL